MSSHVLCSTSRQALVSPGCRWRTPSAKALVLLGAAGLASLALRRASASARHLVWTLALLGALAVPALSIALPRWQVPLVTIPAAPATPGGGTRCTPPHLAPPARAPCSHPSRPTSAAGRSSAASRPPSASPRPPHRTASQRRPLADARGGRLARRLRADPRPPVVGLIGVQWMSRRTEVVADAPWLPLARRLAAELGVSTRVDLPAAARARRCRWPGAFCSPAVLMPADADELAGRPAADRPAARAGARAAARLPDPPPGAGGVRASTGSTRSPGWPPGGRAPSASAPATISCWPPALAGPTTRKNCCRSLGSCGRPVPGGARRRNAGDGAPFAARRTAAGDSRSAVPRSGLTRRARAVVTSIACCSRSCRSRRCSPGPTRPGRRRMRPPLAAVPNPSALNRRRARRPRGARRTRRRPADGPLELPTGCPRLGGRSGRGGARAASRRARRRDRAVRSDRRQRAGGSTEGGRVDSGISRAALDPMRDQRRMRIATPNPNPKPNPNPSHPWRRAVDSRRSRGRRRADRGAEGHRQGSARDGDARARADARPVIFEPLVQALRDASADVREQAAFGLGQLRDKRAVDPLIGAHEGRERQTSASRRSSPSASCAIRARSTGSSPPSRTRRRRARAGGVRARTDPRQARHRGARRALKDATTTCASRRCSRSASCATRPPSTR